MPTAGLPTLHSEFNTSDGSVFRPQLPTFSRRSTMIPDEKGNVVGEMRVSHNKPVDTSV